MLLTDICMGSAMGVTNRCMYGQGNGCYQQIYVWDGEWELLTYI